MNDFQRSKLDRLIYDALQPGRVISDADLAQARGYIDGLLEGDVLSPDEYSEYHRQIMAASRTIFERDMARLRMAS